MLVDFSDRKLAEEAAQRLATILEFSDDAIAMIWRIMLLIGSSPSSWVIDTSRTPFLASRRT
jgi:hypothetical protein